MTIEGVGRSGKSKEKIETGDMVDLCDDPGSSLILLSREDLDLHDIVSVHDYLRRYKQEKEEEIKWDNEIESSGSDKWIQHYEKVLPRYRSVLGVLQHRIETPGISVSSEEEAFYEVLEETISQIDRRASRLYQDSNSEDISKFCDSYRKLEDVYREIVTP